MYVTYLPCVQYLRSAWFLDGRTSTLVIIVFLKGTYMLLKLIECITYDTQETFEFYRP